MIRSGWFQYVYSIKGYPKIFQLFPVAACVTHPLDLTKLRMQTVPGSAGINPSMLRVIRQTVAMTGIKSLYTGLSASMLRQMTYSLVRMGSYEGIKKWIAGGESYRAASPYDVDVFQDNNQRLFN